MIKKVPAALAMGIVLLISVLIAGCSSNTTTSTPSPSLSPTDSHFANYTSNTGFTIQYPRNWNVSEPRNGSVVVLFLLPTNNTSENFNIQVSNPGTRQTLSNFTQQQVAIASKLPGYKLLESRNASIGGNPAHELIYTRTVDGKSLQIMQVWAFHGDQAYLITYKATPDHYNTYIDTVDAMLDSFFFT